MALYEYQSKYGDVFELDLPDGADLGAAFSEVEAANEPTDLQKWTTHSPPVNYLMKGLHTANDLIAGAENKFMEYGERGGKRIAEFAQDLSDDPSGTAIGAAQGAGNFIAQGAAMFPEALLAGWQRDQAFKEAALNEIGGGKQVEFGNPLKETADNFRSNMGAIDNAMTGEGMETFLKGRPAAQAASEIPTELFTPLTEGVEALRKVDPNLGDSADLLMAFLPAATHVKGKPKVDVKPKDKIIVPETPEIPKTDTPALLDPAVAKRIAEERAKANEVGPFESDRASGTRTEDTVPGLLKKEVGERIEQVRAEEAVRANDGIPALQKRKVERDIEIVEGDGTAQIGESPRNKVGALLTKEEGQAGPQSARHVLRDVGLENLLHQGRQNGASVLHYLLRTETNPLYKKLGELLLSRVSHIEVKWLDSIERNGKSFAGMYFYRDNYIGMNRKSGASRHTMYHELVHGATSAWLKAYPNHPLTRLLEELRKEAEGQLSFSTNTAYAAKDMHEFAAEATTNYFVQGVLESIPIDPIFAKKIEGVFAKTNSKLTNAWDAFKTILSNMFVADRPGPTVLNQTYRVISKILDEHVKDSVDQLGAHAKMLNDFSKLTGQKMEERGLGALLSPYEKMTSETTVERFHENWKSKLLEKTKIGDLHDLKHPNMMGLGTESYRVRNAFLRSKDVATAAANFLGDSIARLVSYESSLIYPAMPHLKAFANHYSSLGVVVHRIAEFKKDVGIRLDFEKDPKSWGGGNGKWYPTEQEMIAKGMSKESAKVWSGIDKVLDLTWDSLARSAKMTNTKIPPRVPGYVPHMFKGAYRVQTLLREVGSKDKPIYWTQYNFDSTNKAKKMYEMAMDQHNGKTFNLGGKQFVAEVVFDKPEIMGKKQGEKLTALWDAEAAMPIPSLKKALDNLYTSVTEGTISHVMERGTVPQRGHLLERATLSGEQGLKRSQFTDAINSFERYAEAVFGWETRARYAQEFLLPMKMNGYFEGRPNLRNYVERMSNAFFGISENRLEILSKPIESALNSQGWDPRLAKHFSQTLSSAISVYYLTANPGYYLVNTLQALAGPAILMTEKAKFALAGHKVSVSSALLDYAISGKAEKKGLRDYAEEHGFSRAQFVDEVIPGQSHFLHTLGKPSRMIDSFTRIQGYNMGYHLAKQVMSEKDAREYAGHISREINVPYNQNAGAPLLYGELGMWRPATIFMTFMSHQLGILNNMKKLAMEGATQRNPTAAASAIASFATLVGTGWALFGMRGLPFSSNWDQIGYMLSNVFNFNIPSVQEIGRSMDENNAYLPAGMNTYGLVSLLLGADVTGSGTGVGFNSSDTAIKFLSHIGQASLISGKFVWGQFDASKKPLKSEIADWIRTAPPGMKQIYEYMYKHDMKDILNVAKGTTPDYSMAKDGNLLGNKRTPGEATRSLVGLVPLRESQDKITDNSLIREENAMKAKLDKAVKLLLEADINGKDETLRVLVPLAIEMGTNPLVFIREMEQYEVMKMMDKQQREEYMARTLKGALHKQRRDAYTNKLDPKFRY